MKKLIGSTVVHKIFGKGTVSVLTDKIITVKFLNHEMKFEYPEKFENFLKSEDEKIQNDILKLIDEKKLQKEREEQRAEELRRQEREKKETVNRQNTKKTNAPKQYERKNVAFKCSYCDGGKSTTCIGFKNICSNENIEYNIFSRKYTWCGNSMCHDYYDGEITRKELTKYYKENDMVCYESQMLKNWKAFAGWTESKSDEDGAEIKESKPLKMYSVQIGSLAVLTTRLPNAPENERIIFGVFLVDEAYSGDNFEEGYVTTGSKYKIAFTPKEAEKMRFWDFHNNTGSPENPKWGSGLFRYISDISSANILKRAAQIKHGTKDEKLSREFYEYFCETHGLDSEKLPECEGALKLNHN